MAQSPSSYRHAVSNYVRALKENGVQVQQILLYGSHARKEAQADSDIDIIVLSESIAGKNLLERLQILGLARRNVPEPVQAYGFTPHEVQRRELSAFWEEIVENEAIPITNEVLP
ncbi:nucleotidyltransferase domain-containing protein [bacterium]|nr:nucleotidyltransferase domain-containing protein [bacterium]